MFCLQAFKFHWNAINAHVNTAKSFLWQHCLPYLTIAVCKINSTAGNAGVCSSIHRAYTLKPADFFCSASRAAWPRHISCNILQASEELKRRFAIVSVQSTRKLVGVATLRIAFGIHYHLVCKWNRCKQSVLHIPRMHRLIHPWKHVCLVNDHQNIGTWCLSLSMIVKYLLNSS